MHRKKNGQKKSAFLVKTYEILENAEYEEIISWHQDGIGFVIHQIQKFTQNILPLFFKHSNFTSFIRQLNMYGFSKKKSSKSQNYYYHPKFKKNQKELIRQIQRKLQKKSLNKNSIRRSENPQEIKLSSQLSIQLQSKNQFIKKIQTQPAQRSLNAKLNALINLNQSLINFQLNSLIQIFKDLNSLKSLVIDEQQKKQIQNSLIEYIQAQNLFFSQIQKKYKKQEKQLCKNNKSISKLQTQQYFGDKKDLEKETVSKQPKIPQNQFGNKKI